MFERLYKLHFPIRHLTLAAHGPDGERPKDTDISGSFECRKAVPSPCDTGGARHGQCTRTDWPSTSIPVENPYVGCGQSRDPAAQKYRKRSPHRKGMVTANAIAAFRSVGWGWGGAWTGNTKDYMHFSVNGH